MQKTRGAVAPGKRQCNIRLRVDLLEKIKSEADNKGLRSWVQQLEIILDNRYYPNPIIRKEKNRID